MAGMPSRALCFLPLALGIALFSWLLLPGLQAGTSAFTGILSVELLLPVVGAGVVLGQLPRWPRLLSAVTLLAGAVAGLFVREDIYALMAPVREAASHLFLTGPIACLAVGITLVLPAERRVWIAPLMLTLAGAALAVATRLSDPALFSPHYLPAAFAIQTAIVVAVGWPIARLAHPVLGIASRIAGSWMLAVALLYGGAFMATREPALTPPPFPLLPVLQEPSA